MCCSLRLKTIHATCTCHTTIVATRWSIPQHMTTKLPLGGSNHVPSPNERQFRRISDVKATTSRGTSFGWHFLPSQTPRSFRCKIFCGWVTKLVSTFLVNQLEIGDGDTCLINWIPGWPKGCVNSRGSMDALRTVPRSVTQILGTTHERAQLTRRLERL